MKQTGIIHVLHDPVHRRLNASVIAEMNTLDTGVTWEAHVHQLTNDCLIHNHSYLTHITHTTTI